MYGDGGLGVGRGWVWSLAWLVVMLALFGGVAALVVAALRGSAPAQRREPGSPPPVGGAEQILAERFARGEIDEDEFVRRRAALRSG